MVKPSPSHIVAPRRALLRSCVSNVDHSNTISDRVGRARHMTSNVKVIKLFKGFHTEFLCPYVEDGPIIHYCFGIGNQADYLSPSSVSRILRASLRAVA